MHPQGCLWLALAMQGGAIPELDDVVQSIAAIKRGRIHTESFGDDKQFPPGYFENRLEFDPLRQHLESRNERRRQNDPEAAAGTAVSVANLAHDSCSPVLQLNGRG